MASQTNTARLDVALKSSSIMEEDGAQVCNTEVGTQALHAKKERVFISDSRQLANDNIASNDESLCTPEQKQIVDEKSTKHASPTILNPSEHEVTDVPEEVSESAVIAEKSATASTSEGEDTKACCKWKPSEDDVRKMQSKLSKRGGWDAVGLEGGDQFREYMQFKNRKLRDQFAHEVGMTMKRQDRSAIESQCVRKDGGTQVAETGDVFRNVVVWVDGRTDPGRLEIRKIVMRHGGRFETYWTSRVTHVVADTLAAATVKRMRTRLAASPSAVKKGSTNVKMVTARWVSQSAKLKQRLPEWQFPIPGIQLPGQKSVAALLSKRSTATNEKSQLGNELMPLAKSDCAGASTSESPAKRQKLTQKTKLFKP